MENLVNYPFLHTINKVQKINFSTISNRLGRKPHLLHLPHRTDFNAIYLFTAGHGTHMVDFKEIDVKPGYLLFVRRGQVHHFDPAESYDGHSLIFTDDFFNLSEAHLHYFRTSILFRDPLKIAYFDVSSHFELLCHYFEEIRDELGTEPDRFQRDMLNNCLHNIMLIAERIYAPELDNEQHGSYRMLISDFKTLVDQHLCEQWPVQRYAEALHVHDRTLQNAFRKIEGRSPKQWLNDRLILESKRFLTYGNTPINLIAFELGFKEATNFIKFFRKHVGSSPLNFKKQLLA